LLNFTVYDYSTVGSTNDEVKRLLGQGACEGTVVRAGQQTAGRGQRGRQWISEPGNLYCSLLLTPQCPLLRASQLSFVIAIAAGETLLPFLAAPGLLAYKWPNDILIQEQKIAGILIETESKTGQTADACIIGIGINVHTPPSHPTYPVTALTCHTKGYIALDSLLSALLDKINHYYHIWQHEGFAPIHHAWEEHAYSLGQNMAIRVGNKEAIGQFIGINQEGALLLKKEDGTICAFVSAAIL